jgi:hypothetical protein
MGIEEMVKLPAQGPAESLDACRVPIREIGEGAFANALAFANTFAKEDSGWGVAVGDGVDVHGLPP